MTVAYSTLKCFGSYSFAFEKKRFERKHVLKLILEGLTYFRYENLTLCDHLNSAVIRNTVKFLNFRTPTYFTVSTLKLKLSGSTFVFYL